MEKQSFREKITELAEKTKQMVIEKSMRVFDCGELHPDDFNDDYELPTIVINVVMNYMRHDQRRPSQMKTWELVNCLVDELSHLMRDESI